jgi:hypothetical protein
MSQAEAIVYIKALRKQVKYATLEELEVKNGWRVLCRERRKRWGWKDE